MSIFSHILPTHRASQQQAPEPCSHKTLVPMWDSPQDLGKKDKIARYKCDHCHTLLTLDQVRERTPIGSL